MRDTNRSTPALRSAAVATPAPRAGIRRCCATGLLITDEAAPNVRATMDVDTIARITSYREYVEFADRLREIGFMEDTSEGAPVCRWKNGGVILDVMPLDPRILGFSNRWYREAMDAADPEGPPRTLRMLAGHTGGEGWSATIGHFAL